MSHFRLIFSWFFKLFLAKGRECFLCLTSLFSTILSHFYLFFCGFSALFPFGTILVPKAVVLGAEMHWIASTLCKVCIHSWHALMALDFFVDLMFIRRESLRKKLHYFPLTVISKCISKFFSRAACPQTLRKAHACGDHGHGYAGPKTAFF